MNESLFFSIHHSWSASKPCSTILQMIMSPEYYLTLFPLGLSHRYFLDIGEQLWKYHDYNV